MFNKTIFFISLTVALVFGKAINEDQYIAQPHCDSQDDCAAGIRMICDHNKCTCRPGDLFIDYPKFGCFVKAQIFEKCEVSGQCLAMNPNTYCNPENGRCTCSPNTFFNGYECRLLNDIGDEIMQNPDLFEGDILGFEPGDRNAVVDKYRIWPNGKIPYTIDPLLKEQEPLIKQAMQHYADKTCIRFEPRTDQNQYLRIFKGRGCYSHVGKTLSDQPLSLGPGCYKLPLIIHELGHSIGFYHEHSRSDRDEFLNIHYENIQKGMEDQFVKLRPKQNQLLTPFDYDSMMLYGETVFSKSHFDGLKTMTAKDGRKLKDVTDKPGLSDSDVERITKLYKC